MNGAASDTPWCLQRHRRGTPHDLPVLPALATPRELFGGRQVALYGKLIVEARKLLREQPTIGQLREDLGPGVRVFCIAAAGRINAPHGYVYRIGEDGIVSIARLVHLARDLPDLPDRT